MEYRTLPHGGERISIIGMGSAVIGEQPEEEIIATVRAAVAQGINYFDLASGHAAVFPAYGKALQGIRDQVYLQLHFGADYTSGKYGWTTDLEQIRRSVAWQLEQLGTDYIDIGFIHCLDEDSDLASYTANGVLDYILALKEQGIIRHIGLSSHTPAMVHRVLDMGILDVVMFSINPIYDCGKGDYGIGESQERYDLALLGDELARGHYLALEKRAGDCTACGHCDSRCPFHVSQSQRMQTILAYFGA